MFLFRGLSPEDQKFTPEQSQQSMQKWHGWINELREKDHYVGGEPLVSTGKTLQGKKPVVTDGPFAEGKELVAGYIIIKAESLEKATELAFGFPDFDIQGSVEVREVLQMPMP